MPTTPEKQEQKPAAAAADGVAPVPMTAERRKEIETWLEECGHPSLKSTIAVRDLLAEVSRLAERERQLKIALSQAVNLAKERVPLDVFVEWAALLKTDDRVPDGVVVVKNAGGEVVGVMVAGADGVEEKGTDGLHI